MTVDDTQPQPTGRAEKVFLLGCAGLILLSVVLMAIHAEDLAPLFNSIRETFEAWQQDLELFLELLQGADPETLREDS